MNTSAKGRRAEHWVRGELERLGYTVVRAAASKGPVDLVAWDADTIRLVQVKAGQRGCSPAEREVLRQLVRPTNATVEVWTLRDRALPLIKVLR